MDERDSVGVSIRSISKRYGSTEALKDITLNIEPGEFMSLLGPSGCGKTTLLRTIASYALFPHMSVGENVAFPLRARRLPKSTWPERVKQALAMVELDGYQDRGVSQLSGGQRQRVALARAIVFEPRLILMDEPLSALDKQLRETMQIELRRLHRKLGATVVYVTHDQREALTMSDRVAILKDGELVQIGAPETLHNNPKDSFVASFIGDSTLLPVTRIDEHTVQLGTHTLRSAKPIAPHAELLLAIQTEKLLIDDGLHEPGINRLPCRVVEAVYQGDSLRLFLELEDGTSISMRAQSPYGTAKDSTARRASERGTASRGHHYRASCGMRPSGDKRRLT